MSDQKEKDLTNQGEEVDLLGLDTNPVSVDEGKTEEKKEAEIDLSINAHNEDNTDLKVPPEISSRVEEPKQEAVETLPPPPTAQPPKQPPDPTKPQQNSTPTSAAKSKPSELQVPDKPAQSGSAGPSPDISPTRKRAGSLINSQPPMFNMEKELDITTEDFHKKKRHVIVMTEAGKPVYSRYGDEAEISPIVATLSVIINKLRSIKGDGSQLQLRRLENNSSKTIIYTKYKLFCIYITKDKTDHDFMIQALCESILHQVGLLLSIDSSLNHKLFRRETREEPIY